MISVAGAWIVFLFAYLFAIRPAVDRTASLERVIDQRKENLEDIRRIARDLQVEIQQSHTPAPEPATGFSPVTSLEKILVDSELSGSSRFRSSGEKRTNSVIQVDIDVVIEDAGWEELIGFFERIDAAGPSLQISQFDIRRQRTRRGIDRELLRADISVKGLRKPD